MLRQAETSKSITLQRSSVTVIVVGAVVIVTPRTVSTSYSSTFQVSSGVDGQRVEGKGDGEDHLKGAQKRLPHSVVVLEVPITAVVAVVVVTMSMGGKGASRGA